MVRKDNAFWYDLPPFTPLWISIRVEISHVKLIVIGFVIVNHALLKCVGFVIVYHLLTSWQSMFDFM